MTAAAASELFDSEYHAELLRNLPQITREANIPERVVYTPMQEHCGAQAVDFMRHLKQHSENGMYGLVFHGLQHGVPIQEKMMLMAGAALRNYVHAKVQTLQDVLQDVKAGNFPTATLLLIPNFSIAKDEGGHVADWDLSNLVALLIKRQLEGKQTVVYVNNFQDLEADYGSVVSNHIRENFKKVAA